MPVVPNDGQGFGKLFKEMEKANGNKVDAGFFREQGNHPTATDSSGKSMTYVDLAEYHANGGGGVLPIRDIIAATGIKLRSNEFEKVERAVKNWLRNPYRDIDTVLLPEIGKALTEEMRSVFGTVLLSPTAHNPDPLIDTGELMSHVAYKVNNGAVKES